MPRQEIDLVNGEIYHICYRAVGDSVIFKNKDDHYRGIFSLYEFNDVKLKTIRDRRRARLTEKKKEKFPGLRDLASLDKRDRLVDVLTFCFMPNHIHLLLKQLVDGGVSKFMQKIGGGYANYSNKKHDRKGHLFNQFKAIHVKTNNQLRNVVTYIHCNPISLVEPGRKENGIKSPPRVLNFLENKYRWSGLWDYIGKKNFPSVTEREFLTGIVGPDGFKEETRNRVKYKSKLKYSFAKDRDLFIE